MSNSHIQTVACPLPHYPAEATRPSHLVAPSRLQRADGESTPRYQQIAEDLLERLAETLPPRDVPTTGRIARYYQIPYPTAQFVRRAALTRMRPPIGGLGSSGAATPHRQAWRRVADDLRHHINAGHLTGRLPARPELAALFNVSVDTASKAVRSLTEAGLLVSAGPRGTYVLRQPASTDMA
ncbi:GntR family transcriptional regulator [Streptomyces sp. TRM66268-LWL]|uniref:GntR family transcriptional regulator n=1 Tax=Streptomyces polyasparticus TaxID=2767826 RepID=A0ABR7SX75_9ACTN|nr:GntR family transcriptional regulator [Streptomyces polyasparticus]MBC9719489.1 GntR family transcriptional regulator [Streptomyces polyasparticus]